MFPSLLGAKSIFDELSSSLFNQETSFIKSVERERERKRKEERKRIKKKMGRERPPSLIAPRLLVSVCVICINIYIYIF